mmetsp:Transcript_23521/g.93183  ORF Transcript_23521/g.93183 Transcript_23521/m.93183 type:complete len:80 (+) Transcript_23521:154-393(+)
MLSSQSRLERIHTSSGVYIWNHSEEPDRCYDDEVRRNLSTSAVRSFNCINGVESCTVAATEKLGGFAPCIEAQLQARHS